MKRIEAAGRPARRAGRVGVTACAMMVGVVVGNADACTAAAWSAQSGVLQLTEASSGGGMSSRRYRGLCAMRVDAGNAGFLTTTLPSAEASLSLVFRLYTGAEPGDPQTVVFRAHPGDADTAASLFDIVYDPFRENLLFRVGATTSATAVGSAPRGRWIEVSASYQAGGSLSGGNRHRDLTSAIQPSLAAPATPVEALSMGVLVNSGFAGNYSFDDFESNRGLYSLSEIGSSSRWCGDANGDGSLNSADLSAVSQERQGLAVAAGVPDCNENGRIDVGDALCISDTLNFGPGAGGCTSPVGNGMGVFSSGLEGAGAKRHAD